MSRQILTFILSFSAIFLTLPAQATSLHALHEVEHAAYMYALSEAQARFINPQVSINSLDNRLRLQSCQVPLETFSNTEQIRAGQLTIGVKCHAPVSWTVYVSAQVQVMQDILVTKRALSADHILSAADVELAPRDIIGLRKGYLTDSGAVIGQQLKSPMPMGGILQANQFKEQTLVHRGELITLVAAVGNMEVRVRGEALSNASLGQRVKVKNSNSERIVEGVVDAAGIVRIETM
ncbi:flagellar basal body P-ring formation chaperone FlgA [Methylophaga sp. OBS3]|uniref:flagellar basal body P-ring formation chaperone FlgA n=1 Tax=Methylophaga sp. OBS3 TaxID=2991934 RepID=UPI002254F0FF|nr:flagellar basal body P-ring formation chaperone FlgA [Methylophaga sp. OBS3]MCX4190589.1 flagellar basal body P-ring formation chaperone FlgA [Methylophaga sp. OBS3]